MINERIYLRPGNDKVYLDTYVVDEKNVMGPRQAIIVFPGGAYVALAQHEGEKIALNYVAAGINAFVLKYSIRGTNPDMRYPMPQVDASNAIKYVKDNAERFNIDPEQVYVLGFSAGGHLASTMGTIWHRKEIYDAAEPMEYGYNKPAGMVLCYPVITPYPETGHQGSFKYLLGDDATQEEMDKLSSDKNVDENTCPAFLWHTAADGAVNVKSSLLMANALSDYKIPFELHVYPNGPHGIGLPDGYGVSKYADPHAATWMPLSIEWIKSNKNK